MSWRRIIVIIVVIAALGVGGFYAYQQFTQAETEAAEAEAQAEAELAEAQPPEEFVFAEGVVLPERDVNLSLLGGGRVSDIFASEGDFVEAGDPILTLDSVSLEIARNQAGQEVILAEQALASALMQLTAAEAGIRTAETGVLEAQAQLALLLAGPQAEEIAAAEFDIEAATRNVGQAGANRDATLAIRDSQIRAAEANVASQMTILAAIQDQYDDILNDCSEVPTEDGGKTTICWQYGPVEEAKRAELQEAELQLQSAQSALDDLLNGPTIGQQLAAGGNVTVASANQKLAEAQLALLQADPLAEQIRQAEIGVQLAESGVSQAETAVTQAEAAVTQAEAGLLQAQTNLESADLALERTTLRAPFEGTVATINVEQGELVNPGVPVVSLADFSTWLVETTDLTELDVVTIEPGDEVDVRIDAIPGETLRGTIVDIDTVSTVSRGDVTYVVTIDLGDTSELPLRWGMTVFVDVDLDR